ncbi:MAG: protein phosphatase 2C domain-containing protein [Bacteroidales bacterium]
MIKVYSYSGKGKREANEDYIKSEMLSDSVSLHIVADGMGGYQFGEVASQIATESIFQFFAENTIEGDIRALIQRAVEFANNRILSERTKRQAKLGTTLAGILIVDQRAYVFWLGDVRIEHLRESKQIFLSESHSLINDKRNNGVVSSKDMERYKHIVTRSLSGRPLESPLPVVEIQLRQGDNIIISSDGLYNSIIPASLIKFRDFEIDEKLLELERENKDNISIIIVYI